MKKSNFEVSLLDGEAVITGEKFEKSDLSKFRDAFKVWLKLSDYAEEFASRKINVPELLSECYICYEMDWIRVNNSKGSSKVKTSFDALDLNAKKGENRIQIKSTQSDNDLTSFGPTSICDKLVFAHFAPYGAVDGKIKLYEIDYNLVKKIQVNKNETFEDQQKAGKRPRLSIVKNFIKKGNYESVVEFDLMDNKDD